MGSLIAALVIAAFIFIPGFFSDLRVNRLRCYREIHPEAGLAEAKKAVDKLQASCRA